MCTPRMVSSTRVSLTRMPRRPAAATAAVSASGVAMPSAQGQAITSTAMACISAVAGLSGVPLPGGEGDHGEREHGGNEEARHAVHRALHLGAAGGGLFHGAHDARQRALRSHAGGADLEHAAGVDAAADHAVAHGLGDGHGFAGEHALVGVRAAFDHDAVGGHALAGFDAEDGAGLQGLDRDEALVAVLHEARLAGHQAVEQRERAHGALLGAALDDFAGEHQGDDGAGGIEVDAVVAAEGLHGAVAVGHQDAHGEQRFHAQTRRRARRPRRCAEWARRSRRRWAWPAPSAGTGCSGRSWR